MNDFDMYCIECNTTLPINSDPQTELCRNCKQSRKMSRDNCRYYRKKLSDTFANIKVVLIQSPYFDGKRVELFAYAK